MKTKPAEITYVQGLPKNVPLSFDYIQSLKVADSHVEKGELYRSGRIFNYEGNLENKDFDAIDKIYGSDQFREVGNKEEFLERLKSVTEGKQHLTNTWYETKKITPLPKKALRNDFIGRLFRKYEFIEQKPYWRESTNVKDIDFEASDSLFGELETIIKKHGVPEHAYEIRQIILKEAEDKGEYYPISDFLEFAHSNEITIFVNKIHRGTIRFICEESRCRDEWYPTDIVVRLDGEEIKENKNMYCCGQDSEILWNLDGRIRREILNETNLHEFVRT